MRGSASSEGADSLSAVFERMRRQNEDLARRIEQMRRPAAAEAAVEVPQPAVPVRSGAAAVLMLSSATANEPSLRQGITADRSSPAVTTVSPPRAGSMPLAVTGTTSVPASPPTSAAMVAASDRTRLLLHDELAREREARMRAEAQLRDAAHDAETARAQVGAILRRAEAKTQEAAEALAVLEARLRREEDARTRAESQRALVQTQLDECRSQLHHALASQRAVEDQLVAVDARVSRALAASTVAPPASSLSAAASSSPPAHSELRSMNRRLQVVLDESDRRIEALLAAQRGADDELARLRRRVNDLEAVAASAQTESARLREHLAAARSQADAEAERARTAHDACTHVRSELRLTEESLSEARVAAADARERAAAEGLAREASIRECLRIQEELAAEIEAREAAEHERDTMREQLARLRADSDRDLANLHLELDSQARRAATLLAGERHRAAGLEQQLDVLANLAASKQSPSPKSQVIASARALPSSSVSAMNLADIAPRPASRASDVRRPPANDPFAVALHDLRVLGEVPSRSDTDSRPSEDAAIVAAVTPPRRGGSRSSGSEGEQVTVAVARRVAVAAADRVRRGIAAIDQPATTLARDVHAEALRLSEPQATNLLPLRGILRTGSTSSGSSGVPVEQEPARIANQSQRLRSRSASPTTTRAAPAAASGAAVVTLVEAPASESPSSPPIDGIGSVHSSEHRAPVLLEIPSGQAVSPFKRDVLQARLERNERVRLERIEQVRTRVTRHVTEQQRSLMHSGARPRTSASDIVPAPHRSIDSAVVVVGSDSAAAQEELRGTGSQASGSLAAFRPLEEALMSSTSSTTTSATSPTRQRSASPALRTRSTAAVRRENHRRVRNALHRVLLAGPQHVTALTEADQVLLNHSASHVVIAFWGAGDQRGSFLGLYAMDEDNIDGRRILAAQRGAPDAISRASIASRYKFDTASRSFVPIAAALFTPTTDAVGIERVRHVRVAGPAAASVTGTISGAPH